MNAKHLILLEIAICSCVLAIIATYLTTLNTVFICVAGTLIITYILYYFLTIPTDKRIIRKLKNAGYDCKMVEGRICFRKDNNTWIIYVSNVAMHYKKVAIYLGFELEELKDKSQSQVEKVVCVVGSRNMEVATSWNGEDSVSFIYTTVFNSTNDIMRELSCATDKIEAAARDFFTIKEKVIDASNSTQDHKVGFKCGEKSKPEVQEIRAEKE